MRVQLSLEINTIYRIKALGFERSASRPDSCGGNQIRLSQRGGGDNILPSVVLVLVMYLNPQEVHCGV